MIVECPACHSRYDVTGRPAGTRARCRCGNVFALPEPSRDAALLGCPQCGAGVAADAHRCAYCSAELLVKACPRCFARIFHGAKHCSHCGADTVAPAMAGADGQARVRACPRCEQASSLVARLVGDVLLDGCGECGGVWLDAGALERLISERRDVSVEALLGVKSAPNTVTQQATGSRLYIKCPDCDVVMNRVNFARRSGVIVDVCRHHGTWFDADELPRVIEFAAAGGIEESQRREAEDNLRDARQAKADAAAERTRAMMMGNSGGDAFLRRDRTLDVFGGLLGSIARMLLDR
jgi:Zn-finger nucleic acid-binding protein